MSGTVCPMAADVVTDVLDPLAERRGGMPPDGAPPLAGVRVVDFGHYIAGPLAGMLLADQGAQVIKIDRPGARSADPADAMYNRGKTRLELDLKSEAGLAAEIGRAHV